MVLEIEDLVVRYKTGGWAGALRRKSSRYAEVLAGIDLSLNAGRTLGVVGESGSGKTTLARAVVGLAPIARGGVRVDGMRASGWGDGPWRFIRRKVGFMFQDPLASLDPRMDVAMLVTEPFVIHRTEGIDRRREAARLLDLVGLPARFLDRYPYQLSGGQARRVSVARALALKPKLVIADEPTAGLDLSIQGDVLNLMTDLQAELGMSYLLITHNLTVARHIADEIAVMYLGRIVETGPTDAVYRAPAHPYTRALLGARGGGERMVLEGEPPGLSPRPGGCEFHARCPIATPRCSAEAPVEQMVGPRHRVLCHFPAAHPALAGAA
jgi:oligopeptide/dipeptide ABC transporter ATP-binding protein